MSLNSQQNIGELSGKSSINSVNKDEHDLLLH